MARPIATECVNDIISKLEKLPALKGKAFHVMSDQELLDKTKVLMYTCAAVIYGGMREAGDGKETHKVGNSVEISMDILLFFRTNAQAKDDPKEEAVALLDGIRGQFLDSRAPTGHFWRFRSETSIELKTGLVGYLQRWTSPAQIT